MDSQKQQVAERVKQANNILVTVSSNPSVDQLAACIGLTLSLNKMGKHATAVFSGAVPSTIEFLQPEKTLEKTTDSLRDFIIALDKSKADKLRYKVEDTVVKIFITPYRTSIGEKDLEFSQGDFNVDVVLALGVHNQAELDQAITAHGRILHDATVVTLNTKPGGELGSINWLDPTASSLSELSTQLVDMLDKSMLDTQIATALLTGVVAETERFSNAKTSPQTMTISAELMAAGANQQLVATKLEEAEAAPPPPPASLAHVDGDTDPAHIPQADDMPLVKKADDGTLEISHENDKQQPEEDTKDKDADSLPSDEEGSQTGAELTPEPDAVVDSNPKPPEIPEPFTLPEPTLASAKDEEPKPPKQEQAPEPAPAPNPPVQPPSEPLFTPDPEPQNNAPQIHIDEHGALSPLDSSDDDIDESLLPPPTPPVPHTISHHDQALTMGGPGPVSTAAAAPVAGQYELLSSDPLTSLGNDNAVPEHLEPSLPPIGVPPTPSVHKEEPPTPESTPDVPAKPKPPKQEQAPEPAPAPNPPVPAVQPPTPAFQDEQTLTDIEQDVHSPHLAFSPPAAPAFPMPAPSTPSFSPPPQPAPTPQPPALSFPEPSLMPPPPQPLTVVPPVTDAALDIPDSGTMDMQSARDAVSSALNTGNAPDSLPPIEGLNAQPVNLDLGHNVPAPQQPTSMDPLVGTTGAVFSHPPTDDAPTYGTITIPTPEELNASFPQQQPTPSLMSPPSQLPANPQQGSSMPPPPVPPPMMPPSTPFNPQF